MANGFKLSSVVGGGSVGFKHKNPTADYEIGLPNENIDMPMMRLSTAKASTSGTFIDFTDVPSWAKKITVMFDGVSLSGTSNIGIQLGSGAIQTSGYVGVVSNNVSSGAYSTMFQATIASSAVDTYYGKGLIDLSGNNTFNFASIILSSSSLNTRNGCGSVTLSGQIDRIRITTVNGTDLFDAGSINVLYEGY